MNKGWNPIRAEGIVSMQAPVEDERTKKFQQEIDKIMDDYHKSQRQARIIKWLSWACLFMTILFVRACSS